MKESQTSKLISVGTVKDEPSMAPSSASMSNRASSVIVDLVRVAESFSIAHGPVGLAANAVEEQIPTITSSSNQNPSKDATLQISGTAGSYLSALRASSPATLSDTSTCSRITSASTLQKEPFPSCWAVSKPSFLMCSMSWSM